MKEKTDNLKNHLQGTLAELNRLASQIREMHDISEEAETLLCLKELVQEQIETKISENTSYSNHASR